MARLFSFAYSTVIPRYALFQLYALIRYALFQLYADVLIIIILFFLWIEIGKQENHKITQKKRE